MRDQEKKLATGPWAGKLVWTLEARGWTLDGGEIVVLMTSAIFSLGSVLLSAIPKAPERHASRDRSDDHLNTIRGSMAAALQEVKPAMKESPLTKVPTA
jgi:hypothetical protein